MALISLHTGPGVFEVLAHVCRSPQEALKQFVENAADAIEQADREDGEIRLGLEYGAAGAGEGAGTLRSISVADNGVGMTVAKMREVLSRIGDSEKINLALRGEQGIGLLAFALIAEELHLASSAEEGSPSACLVLKRAWLKRGHAEVTARCCVHLHTHRGTVAYLEGVLPEIAPQMSRERVKEYLGQQFAPDLRANMYAMSVADARGSEQIHSQRFRGVKALSTSLRLGRGSSAFMELYVLPWSTPDAAVSLYGRGGARICLLTELADFKALPWLDQRLEGYIRCDNLKRTADKTAVVQNQTFHAFVTELRRLEPEIQRLISEISAQSLEQRFNVLFGRLGRLIDKFLRYRERGLLGDLALGSVVGARPGGGSARLVGKYAPVSAGLVQEKGQLARPPVVTRGPNISLRSPSDDRANYRSWYDPGAGAICINREHAEFLLSQREERRCLRYLFSVWAKESILQEFGADAEKVADEMVGVLAEAEPLLR